MSNNGNTLYDNLFSSLISEIKSYDGLDPLLPWLRGIRKMKEVLPPQLLKEKLPRFLQKCSETFLTDRRYSNDLRYLRVWLQLMDFVDDPKPVLKTMEKNRIGAKRSLFYQAYALYYEKMKKFDAAEKIYHLGVQNLAEPADELQKSYEQLLHRMGRHKNKRVQLRGRKPESGLLNRDEVRGPKDDMPMKNTNHNDMPANSNNIGLLNDQFLKKVIVCDFKDQIKSNQDEDKRNCGDDTVVIKFVDTAIVGKSKAEDARHHGLVEPTINTREAMNAINSMFREPIEPSVAGRKIRNQTENNSKNGFNIFTDESLEAKDPSPFEIYVDGEETSDLKEQANGNSIQAQSCSHTVFAKPTDVISEDVKDPKLTRAHQAGLQEDTVVHRFVGSISDEPEVENVWHHGLVDPTVNLKEAMEDINSMFGKPIEFVTKSRPKKHDKAPGVKNNCGGFLILADDEPENEKGEDDIIKQIVTKCSPRKREKANDVMNNQTGFLILPDDELDNEVDDALPSSSTSKGSDLFEQTLCTKEAMAEINKLFAMPMDF